MFINRNVHVQRVFHLNGANILCFVSWAIQTNVSHSARKSSSNTLTRQMSNTYIVFVCIFARSQSFYDFYGNTTQVRNIYGITISSFIVDINFTHWIATVFVGSQPSVFCCSASFRGPFTPLLCLLFCMVIFMSITLNLYVLSSICVTKHSTKQSTKTYSSPPDKRMQVCVLVFEYVSKLQCIVLFNSHVLDVFPHSEFFICVPV